MIHDLSAFYAGLALLLFAVVLSVILYFNVRAPRNKQKFKAPANFKSKAPVMDLHTTPTTN